MQDAVWVGEDGGWGDEVVEGVGEDEGGGRGSDVLNETGGFGFCVVDDD